MANIKIILFIIGLILVTYVGGVPEDSRNFFIVHTFFITPIMLEFYSLTKTKKGRIKKYFINPIWGAGILVLILNIVGIIGFISIAPAGEDFLLTFASNYYFLEKLNISIGYYFIFTSFTAMALFISNIAFEHRTRITDSESRPEAVNA